MQQLIFHHTVRVCNMIVANELEYVRHVSIVTHNHEESVLTTPICIKRFCILMKFRKYNCYTDPA